MHGSKRRRRREEGDGDGDGDGAGDESACRYMHGNNTPCIMKLKTAHFWGLVWPF